MVVRRQALTRQLLRWSVAAVLCIAALPLVATARTHHLLPPTINRVSGSITLPKQDSGTLPLPVMNWLRNQGLSYVIPYVPWSVPSDVKLLTVARAAATHTPVGPQPVIRQLAFIAPITAMPPLRAHSIYWAIILSSRGSPSDVYYVACVGLYKPIFVGSLFHAH
jgi:hypothetical protein